LSPALVAQTRLAAKPLADKMASDKGLLRTGSVGLEQSTSRWRLDPAIEAEEALCATTPCKSGR
jgi:hypothetical protein